MLYQRVTGDFYTINSEGKFTLPRSKHHIVRLLDLYYNIVKFRYIVFYCHIFCIILLFKLFSSTLLSGEKE